MQYENTVKRYIKQPIERVTINRSANAKNIIPISGGADSTCTAIVLLSLFPEIDWILVFTDTGDESKSIYQRLDDLERIFNKRIHRVSNGDTLFSLVEKFNGFLPSSRARFCTKSLKIEPLDRWITETFSEEDEITTMVGIRADEDRFGMVSDSDNVHTEFPLTRLGLGKEEVFSILDETIGLPLDYKDRTRSGCQACFYQANHELIRFYINNPQQFHKSGSYESFCEVDTNRFNTLQREFERDYEQAFNSLNPGYANYCIPKSVDIRKDGATGLPKPPNPAVKKDSSVQSLFDHDTIVESEEYEEMFVAVAFLVEPLMELYQKEGSTGVYDQRFISYSKSFEGLKRSMAFYWRHRLNTAQVWGETESSILSNMKIVIYRLELPSRLVDFGKTSKQSYSWKSDITYTQLEHHFKIAHTLLSKAGLEQRMNEIKTKPPTDDNVEEYLALKSQWDRLKQIPGYVSWAGLSHLSKGKGSEGLIALQPTQSELFEVSRKKRVSRTKRDSEDNTNICVACSI